MQSDLEAAMQHHLRVKELEHEWWPLFEPEYKFSPRKFRFDFACKEIMLGVECEGGIWTKGRHVRGKGFEDDCFKYDLAVELGWGVLRYTAGMIESGEAILQVERIVKERMK